jgi:TetR/AcrR family transcriptional regulator, lmrAB and yxaGH operons repressor
MVKGEHFMKETNSKDKILNAASMLFNKQGYNATSLNQITEVSHSPRGSVYYYFPGGKEQLAKEAIKETGESIKELIKETLSSHESTALGICDYIKKIAMHLEQSDERTTISLVAMSSEVWSTNETLRQMCEDVYQEWEEVYVQSLVDSGYEKEEAARLSTAIQSLIEGAYTLSLTKKSTQPLYIASEMVLKLLK